jgi:hypothetical protein
MVYFADRIWVTGHWGFFLSICASSRVLLGVPAEACGLRQPPELAVPVLISIQK